MVIIECIYYFSQFCSPFRFRFERYAILNKTWNVAARKAKHLRRTKYVETIYLFILQVKPAMLPLSPLLTFLFLSHIDK